MTHKQATQMWWTFAITSVALFMVTLDNLVVTTALPVIRERPARRAQRPRVDRERVHAHLRGAAPDRRRARRPLRPPAHVRDRARRSSPLASAAAALAPSIGALDAARAVQGLGGAIVMPLTLTILSAGGAGGAARRLALGAWGGISGLAVAFGPLVGGAVVSGISWHWIFWLNVPIGLVLAPLALPRLDETYGPVRPARPAGPRCSRAPACSGSSGGSSAATRVGWSSPEIVGALVAGARRDRRVRRVGAAHAEQPMLPMRFFRNRTFALANVASLFMCFGMFGSIFLLAQFFQTVQGYSPLQSGPAHPAVDGDADDRRADRRRALRPDRRRSS